MSAGANWSASPCGWAASRWPDEDAQTRTVMILYLDEAFHAWHRAGRMKAQHDLFESITHGAVQCVLPKR